MSFAREFIALGLFFSDGEESDARSMRGMELGAEDGAEIDLAHDGELLEVVGLGVDVGADVEKDSSGPGRCREDRSQRGTIDTGECAENHLGGGHRGTGISGTDETSGVAFTNE